MKYYSKMPRVFYIPKSKTQTQPVISCIGISSYDFIKVVAYILTRLEGINLSDIKHFYDLLNKFKYN